MSNDDADDGGTGTEGGSWSWRPKASSIVLFLLAEFCASVGIGSTLLGLSAAKWYVFAALLLLAGIATGD